MRLPHGRIHTSTMKLLRFLAQFLWFIVWFLRFLVRFFHPSLMYPPHPSQIHKSTRQHENSLSFRFDPSSFIPPLSLVVYSVFSLTYRLIGKNCLIFEKTDWFSIFFFQILKIKLWTNFQPILSIFMIFIIPDQSVFCLRIDNWNPDRNGHFKCEMHVLLTTVATWSALQPAYANGLCKMKGRREKV
jgi:hypothetical protein